MVYYNLEFSFPALQYSWLNSTESRAARRDEAWTDGTVKDSILYRMGVDYHDRMVVYLNPKYTFDKYLTPDLMNANDRHVVVRDGQEIVLEAIKGLKSIRDPTNTISMATFSASKPLADPNLRCSILLRQDFSQLHRHYSHLDLQLDKNTIVLGVPTTSKKTEKLEDHPLTMILLPSLIQSVTLNPQYKFVLLIGYDVGDRYFDNPANLSVIKSTISALYRVPNLSVYFIRLVKTGAVTMVWNMLYDIAIQAGAHYFYQLNDDITFKSHHWPAEFTGYIDQNDGYGLVGPRDRKFGCKLMTQNFVGRGHHQIFGFLFPPDLHNWFSDTWLNIMYGNLGLKRCNPAIGIVNGGRRDGPRPRYMACKQSDHAAMLNRLQDQAEKHLLLNKVKLKYIQQL